MDNLWEEAQRSIMKWYKAGDETNAEEFVRLMSGLIWRKCYQLARSQGEEVIRELRQEVLHHLLDRTKRPLEGAATGFRSLFWTCVRNRVWDVMKVPRNRKIKRNACNLDVEQIIRHELGGIEDRFLTQSAELVPDHQRSVRAVMRSLELGAPLDGMAIVAAFPDLIPPDVRGRVIKRFSTYSGTPKREILKRLREAKASPSGARRSMVLFEEPNANAYYQALHRARRSALRRMGML